MRSRACGGVAALAALIAIAPGIAGGDTPAAGSYVLGAETRYGGADRDEVARSVRRRSDAMLAAMATLDAEAIKAFYGRASTYVGAGVIGDWEAILAGTAARYAARRSVSCRWGDPFRIDLLTRDVAVVTAVMACDIVDSAGRATSDETTRLEVLSRTGHQDWTIVAVHEAPKPR